MSKYVVPLVRGGMGNQLFILAAGLQYAIEHDAVVIVDVSAVASPGITPRPFYWKTPLMQRFLQHDRVLSLNESQLLECCNKGTATLTQSLAYAGDLPNLFASQRVPTVRLNGYFQSPKYFEDDIAVLFYVEQAENVLDKFQEATDVDLNETQCVSLHVRRGDYVKLQKLFAILDESYYKQALDQLDLKDTDCVVVFSDDSAWCRAHLNALHSHMVFVDENQFDDLSTFSLMQRCTRGQVIANSTFSWWAAYTAWLKSDKHLPVCMPRPWFVDGKTKECPFLQADGWTVIDVT